MLVRRLLASALPARARSFTGAATNGEVLISAAVTGSGDTVSLSPHVPYTPEQIANDAIAVWEAGAAVAHMHVRDPTTGAPARGLAEYREVVERIRDHPTCDVIINLTCGMGGDFYPNKINFHQGDPGTDLVGADERLAHIEELRPEICSLDCGSLNFGNSAYISTMPLLEEMAERITAVDVTPELECFELGHVGAANRLVSKGFVKSPPFYQFALGIPWAAPADGATITQMRDLLPDGANWAAFGISRFQMPMVAQSMLLGGHVRVGLEDNLYISKGVLATNAQLVERAKVIVEGIGSKVLSPAEARVKLGLRGTQ